MSYTYKIVYTIIYVISINITFLMGFSFIGENLEKIIRKLSIISLFIGFFYYYFYNFLNINYLILCTYISLIPIFKKVFKFSYSRIIVANLFALISRLIMQISVVQISSYYSISNNVYRNTIWITIIVLAIYFLLLILVNWKELSALMSEQGSCSMLKQNQKEYLNRDSELFISILILMILWIFYFMNNLSLFSFKYQNLILFLIITLFIMLISFMKMLVFHKMEKVEIFVDQQFQKEVLDYMKIIRSQRHDFNFHLQAISGMLEKENYKECKEYIKTMVKDAQDVNQTLPLYHPAVSALLNGFTEIAAQNKIQLQMSIHYNMERIPCTVYEINKIIGNLIQNAIDEVEESMDDNKWVQVIILKRSGNCVIKVSNKTNKGKDSFKKIFDFGYSTKPSHEGIGLNTVHKITSKYSGSFYIEFEDNIVNFIVRIPIKY